MMELVNLITKNLTLDLHNTDFHKKKKKKKKTNKEVWGMCKNPQQVHSKSEESIHHFPG